MPGITEEDITEAERADLEGVSAVRHGDKAVTYDPEARARGIARAKRRLQRKPHVGLASPAKGY